jgi:hypothetical protein
MDLVGTGRVAYLWPEPFGYPVARTRLRSLASLSDEPPGGAMDGAGQPDLFPRASHTRATMKVGPSLGHRRARESVWRRVGGA